MKKRWTKAIVVGVLAVLVIAVGALVVFAQGEGSTPDDAPVVPMQRSHWRGFHGDFGYQQEDLAEALGITVEELEAAQREAKMKQVERAVDEGYLSADQGNLMLAMIALENTIDKNALLAAALDMDVEELNTAIEDGTLREKLAEIAPADLQAGMEEAFEAALQQAQDDLLITEEQAQLVREHLGAGFGFRYHPYGFGRHGRFNRGGVQPAPSSSLPTLQRF